jgi:hypothetical protein
MLPPPDKDQEQAHDRDAAAVINPSRRFDHEARGRIGKISRSLPHEDQSGDKKDDSENDERCTHVIMSNDACDAIRLRLRRRVKN